MKAWARQSEMSKVTLVVEGRRQDYWYPTSMRLDVRAMAGLASLAVNAFRNEHGLPGNVEPQLIWDPPFCEGADPTCPCQDGDWCHYVDDPETGTPAMPRG